jgi:5-methylthioadenosine/S-adenosylhomocysteine deaminase
MATRGGARALGMEKEIGSLEAGKKADVIVVEGAAPHAVPLFDVTSQLVYALKASDVREVFIDGRLVMRDRRVLTLDRQQVIAKAQEYRQRIVSSLPK